MRGALIGCAFGDAFGMPTEMLTREQMNEAFPDGISRLEPSSDIDFFGRRFVAGTVTDDTENTVLVCRAIAQGRGSFSTERYLELLQQWVRENADRVESVLGPSTRRALSALEAGASIADAGRLGTTNGSAMKVAPIGIVYDPAEEVALVDAVERLCLPTHNTGVAIAGASAVAGCVGYAVRGEGNLDVLWEVALRFAGLGACRGNQLPGPSLCERLVYVRSLVEHEPEHEVLRQIEDFLGMGPETIETVPAAFAMVALANGDPHRAAVLAANIPGDTDTVASIACTICGAVRPGFSNEEVELLERVNGLDFDAVARGLVSLVGEAVRAL